MLSEGSYHAPVERFFGGSAIRPLAQHPDAGLAGHPPRVAQRLERRGEGVQRAVDWLAGHLLPASRLLGGEHGLDALYRRLARVLGGLARLHLAHLAEEDLL